MIEQDAATYIALLAFFVGLIAGFFIGTLQ